jgi:arsenate reductase
MMRDRALEKVLFICVHNMARSQMAEGLCNHFLSHRFEAYSAGSHPAQRVHPMAIAALGEIGIDLSKNRPKGIEDFDLKDFDLIVTLCAEEECPVLPSSVKKLNWHLQNPVSQITTSPEDHLRKFRKIRDEIKKLILSLDSTPNW